MSNLNLRNKEINKALTIKLDVIPDKIPEFQEHIRRAPKRESKLTNADIKLALKNALRYIPEEYHEKFLAWNESNQILKMDASTMKKFFEIISDYGNTERYYEIDQDIHNRYI